MPTYDYKCAACGEQFSRRESMNDHGRATVACPKCKATQVERVLSAAYPRTARKS